MSKDSLFSSAALAPMARWFNNSVSAEEASPGRIDSDEIARGRTVAVAVLATATKTEKAALRRDVMEMQRKGLISNSASAVLLAPSPGAKDLAKESSLQPTLLRILAWDEGGSPTFGDSSAQVFDGLGNQMNWGEERVLIRQLEGAAALVLQAGAAPGETADRLAMSNGMRALACILRQRKGDENALLDVDDKIDRAARGATGKARISPALISEAFACLRRGLADREPYRLSRDHVRAFLSRFEGLQYNAASPYSLSEDIERFLAETAPRKPHSKR